MEQTGQQGRPPAFAAKLDAWGESVAVIAPGEVVTYRELAALADDFAADRFGSDIGLIALEAQNSVACVVAYLAALRANIPVIMHSGTALAAPALTACPADLALDIDPVTRAYVATTRAVAWEASPRPELAVLLATSGSSGVPKLVKLSRQNLASNAEAIADYLGLGPDDRAISSLPLSYSFGLSVLNSHLSVGASMVLTEAGVADPEFLDEVRTHRVTGLAGVPHSYDLMLQAGLLANLPAGVRTLVQAGGRMAPDVVTRVRALAERQGARFFVMYGQTEATARIAYLPPDLVGRYPEAIGRAIPGGELWVQGEGGERLPRGREGVLTYRGPNVMMGYASSREDLAKPPGPDILETGDLAIEIAPGIFSLTGRTSRFVKPFGLRVGLDDLEARCREAGAECLVAGSDDLIVVAMLAEPERAKEAIASTGLTPGLFEFVRIDEVPRLGGGKVDYAALLRLGQTARAASHGAAGGFAPVEEFYTRLAQGKPLSDDDSFVRLGGDSLSYVQCSLVLEAAIGSLPGTWPRMRLGELRKLHRNRPLGGKPSSTVGLDGDVLIRCLAILQVVFAHAYGNLGGGAYTLMVLAGFTWSRFQRPRIEAVGPWPSLREFLTRYVTVYLAAVLAVSALHGDLHERHILFHSTLFADWGGVLNTYWFIESLTWCVALACAGLAVQWILTRVQLFPYARTLGFIALALGLRLAGAAVFDAEANAYRSPDQTLVFFACGWAIAIGSSRVVRAIALAVIVGVAFTTWGFQDVRAISVSLLCAGLCLVGRVRLPSFLRRGVALFAAASFYIYLANPFPMYLTEQILDERYGKYAGLQVGLTLILGLGAYLLVERLTRSLGDWKRAELDRKVPVV